MLIGFAGLSGSGKSTAIGYLVTRGLGSSYYAGVVLTDEISRLGLAQDADTEKNVRGALRRDHGMAVFAERALPHLRDKCADAPVLLDAIYCPEERDCYLRAFGSELVVVAIIASFETRSQRLERRAERPISREKLVERDALELHTFRIGAVVEEASFTVQNDGKLNEFKQALDRLFLDLS